MMKVASASVSGAIFVLCVVVFVAMTLPLVGEMRQLEMGQKRRSGNRVNRVKFDPKNSLEEKTDRVSATSVVEKLKQRYDRTQPPQKDRPTEVLLGIYINSFFSISEQTMDYSLSMYFRQQWRDPRLSFEPINGKVREIRLYDGSWDFFWVPDTFFRNEKGASFHKVTVNNRRLTVNSTGHLWYATRITATLSCPMKLQKFPLDTQSCPMQFESFGYTMDTLFFGWVRSSPVVDMPDDLELPQFELVRWILHDCSSNYTSGSYPCSEIRFILRRDIGYYVIQVFVPSILTVILSWVSFWINIDGVPARVSLGLLTVLTIATQSGGINATLPRVSYIKAIDVWMIVCLVFVFCALLEYAFVNVAARNGVRIRTPIYRNAPPVHHPNAIITAAAAAAANAPPEDTDMCLPSVDQECSSVEISTIAGCFQAVQDRFLAATSGRNFVVTIDVEGSKRRARRIDKLSRKAFPLAFILFNIIYWISASLPDSADNINSEL